MTSYCLHSTLFSVYLNDVPVASNGAEERLLFADDIVYTLRFPYKRGKSEIQKANQKAIEIAKLEQ
jgi:hypothetical protein